MDPVCLDEFNTIISSLYKRHDLWPRSADSASTPDPNLTGSDCFSLPQKTLSLLSSPSIFMEGITKYHGYAASNYWHRSASFLSQKLEDFQSFECLYWFLFEWQGLEGIPKYVPEHISEKYRLDLGPDIYIHPVYWIWKKGQDGRRSDCPSDVSTLYNTYALDKGHFLNDCISFNICQCLYSLPPGAGQGNSRGVHPSGQALLLINQGLRRVTERPSRAEVLSTIFRVAISNPTDYKPFFRIAPESIIYLQNLHTSIDQKNYPLFPLLAWAYWQMTNANNCRTDSILDTAPTQGNLLDWYIHSWCRFYPSHLKLVDIDLLQKHEIPEYSDENLQDAIEIVAKWDGSGLSKNAEMTYEALRYAGRESLKVHLNKGYLSSSSVKYSASHVIFHANADDCVEFILKRLSITPGKRLHQRYHGFFLWELDQYPLAHELGCNLVDSIMLASEFLSHTYSQFSSKTKQVGKAVFLPSRNKSTLPREANKLATYHFVFLIVFDSESSVERKNPYPAVKAFEQLYAGNHEVCLVIKASAPHKHHWGDPFGQYERIKKIAKEHENIVFIERRLTDDEIFGLVHACDSIISSHRAEGFGYLMSYAILAKKQLISTGYSGICNELRNLALPWLPIKYTLQRPVTGKFYHEMTNARWADINFADLKKQMLQAKDQKEEWKSIVNSHAKSYERVTYYFSQKRYATSLVRALNG